MLVALVLASVWLTAEAGRGGGRSGHSGRSASHSGHSHGGTHRHFVNRARIGVFAGAAVYAPLYYYGAHPVYVPPAQDQIYIERPPDPAYWYFCPGSNSYYPYVSECPGGWELVVPPTNPAPSSAN
jgi:hypothetical protein